MDEPHTHTDKNKNKENNSMKDYMLDDSICTESPAERKENR